MAELGRNVVQHAGSPVGGVAIAQYFPDRKAVQVAMCDGGQGVFSSLRTTYPVLHDIFRIPGSLTKLIFRRCTRGTEEAVRLVAAYSATYRQKQM